MTTSPLSAYDVLTTTRSVRKRLDFERPVDLAVIRECLEVALQAPSGSNRQGWHFVVVTDPELRAAIGELYHRSVASYLESEGSAAKLFADSPERASVQHRIGDSVAYLGDHMAEAPVLVLPCVTVGGALSAENQAGLWGSILPAAWSFMLALRLRGLASAWTTLHLVYEAEVASLLGIPDTIRQGALIPVAYPIGESFRPAARAPLDDVLHVDGW
ncbi:MAG TPA: nitroreductase family protein [Mycobacteriales bacterium]|jgi:nitroreductase|nr:nitroreductase family protein [Mycobacteriales bacterium]